MFARTLGNSTSRTGTWRFIPPELNLTALSSQARKVLICAKGLLAFDNWLRQGRGDFDLLILLSGSRLASSSTSCLGSVRVLRNKILVILPLTLILLRL